MNIGDLYRNKATNEPYIVSGLDHISYHVTLRPAHMHTSVADFIITYNSLLIDFYIDGTNFPVVPKFKVGDILECNTIQIQILDFDKTDYRFQFLCDGSTGCASFSNIESYYNQVKPSGISSSAAISLPAGSVNPIYAMPITPQSWQPALWASGQYLFETQRDESKCECGAYKTYGENCGPENHSHWCEIVTGGKS